MAVHSGYSTRAPRGVFALSPLKSGDFVSGTWTASSLGGAATANNRFDLYPVIFGQRITIDQLSGYVTTGVASAKCRFGIYATDSASFYPGALVCDSGELDCSSSSTAIAGTVSAILEPDTWYWLACISNSTQTLRVITLGSMRPMKSPDGTSNNFETLYRLTQNYGALPSTCPAGGTATSAAAPFIRIRVA